MLASRIQIFEYLLETFYRHALDNCNRRVQKKMQRTCLFPTETPGHYYFFEGLRSVYTFSTLAPVLLCRPSTKKWLKSSSSTLSMAVSMILNRWHSSSHCMRHSWADTIWDDNLEPARSSLYFVRLWYSLDLFKKKVLEPQSRFGDKLLGIRFILGANYLELEL